MAKSKARFLAEILGSDGKVQKGKSKGFEEIALSDLPTITNAKLQNSAVTFAGETASLGGSASLDTGDISEHTNYKYFTDARSRGSISASLASGHGAVSYNSTTGALSITGVSTEAIQDVVGAMFSSNTESGITVTYDDSDGTIDLSVTALNTGNVSEGSNLYHTTARARAAISATGSLAYNSSTGVMSFTMPAQNTSNITEGTNKYYTDARAISAVTGSDLDMGGRKVLFGNMYSAEGNLPSASTYHGMFAHVHGTGKGYFAHGGNWIKLLDESSSSTANLTEGSNLYYTASRVNAAIDARVTQSMVNALGINATHLNSSTGGSYALKASPALTGTPTAPTAAANTNTTQIATTAYVQTELTDLIDGAPGTLDSLNELAAAINDDSNYNSTLTTALATKVNKTSNQALGNAANVMTISGNTITLARGDSTTDTVTVPDTNTTYTTATSSALGLVKIGYTESGKNYPVELSSGQMYVNVPWVDTNTDTNTTYTGGTNISLSGTTFNLDNQIVLSTGVVATKGAFGTGQSGVHNTYHLYNNSLTYLNGATIIDANLTISGGGAILGSPNITAGRVITSGLYGTTHGSSTLPIWQYDAGNPGYGIAYTESSPDVLRFDVSGNLMSGTADLELRPNDLKVNGSTVWHAGNDGSGTGLDADLLDGYHGNNYIGKNGATYYGPNTWIDFNTTNEGLYWSGGTAAGHHIYPDGNVYMRFRSGASSSVGLRLQNSSATTYGSVYANSSNYIGFLDNSANWALQVRNNGTIYRGNGTGLIWDSANDGSGSGLDADLLDGAQGSDYVRATQSTAITAGNVLSFKTSGGSERGFLQATDTNDEHFIIATSGGEDIGFKDGGVSGTTNMIVRGDGSMWLRDDLDMGGDLNLGTSGTGNTLNAKYGQIIGGFGAVTTSGTTDWNHSTNARSGSGHTLLYGNATNGPDSSLSGRYYHPFSFEYASYDGDGNMAQFAIPYAHNDAGPYFRTRYSGTWGGWVELWHSGNDGAGSGLDADHLDGSTWATQTKAVAARNLTIEAGDGQGIGFWGGTGTVLGGSYAIAMASQGNGNAGRHSLDSSSDYNMYFKMSGGTDRGFVFKNSGTNVAAITSGGRFLGSAVYLDGSSSQNQYVAADSTHSLTIRNMGATAHGGLVLQGSDGTHGLQLYFDGSGANYGFLDGAWASWDIQKIRNGTFKVDEGAGLKRVLNEANWSSYITLPTDTNTIDGRGFVNTGSNSAQNADTINSNGISYYTSGVTNFSGNATDGALYSQQYSSSWQHQIAGDYRSGQIAVRGKNNGTFTSWNKVWTAGNDGSGSGLDADLLDGKDSLAYVGEHNGTSRTIQAEVGALHFYGDGLNSGQSNHSYAIYQAAGAWSAPYPDLRIAYHTGIQIGGHSSYNGTRFYNDQSMTTEILSVGKGDNHVRVAYNLYRGGNTVWDAGNDGSGSGLDADLLDGYQLNTGRADVANRVVATDSNGYIQAGWINTTSGDAGAIVPTRIYTSDGGSSDAYIRYLDLASFRSVMNSPARSGSWYQGREQSTSDTNYWVGTMGYGTVDFDTVFRYGSGFIDSWSNPANQPSNATSHWVGNQSLHYTNGTADYGWQMLMGAGTNGLLYVRGKWNSAGSWSKVWNDANDGSGSGLDADTLDGVDSASFLRSDANDTATGQYTFSKVSDHAIRIGTIRGTVVGSNSGEYIQMYERVHIGSPVGWGSRAAPSYGLSTYGGADFATDTGSVTISGNTAWHAGNDGSGSGLDADLLDGVHLSYINRGTNTSGVFPGASGYNLNDVFTSTPRAGFIDAWSGSNFPPGTTHIQGIQTRHATSTHYGWQLFGQYNQAGKLYHRQVSNNSWGSWSTMWSSGNDGSGSGLDADLLDGMNAAASGGSIIMKTESNGYSQLNNWTQVGGAGLYSSTTNGAHWYANTASSYGSWRMNGSRNGYSGTYHNNGGGVVSGMYDSGGNGGDYRESGGGWYTYFHVGNNCLGINASSTSSSYGAYVTGALYATGDVVGSSDRRLKKNINTIENGLAKVEKLRGVTYEWKDSKESGSEGNNVTPERMGVIAQEIVDIVPEVVTHDKENDRYGVSYGHLTGVLIEAIKELSDKVKELEKKLEEK